MLFLCINWPRMPWFWPLLLDTPHLLEMVLNYSNLDLSKIATLKWRLEKRRLDFFPPEILNARKIELFELMNCLKQLGGLPICSTFTKLNLFSELSGGKILLRYIISENVFVVSC